MTVFSMASRRLRRLVFPPGFSVMSDDVAPRPAADAPVVSVPTSPVPSSGDSEAAQRPSVVADGEAVVPESAFGGADRILPGGVHGTTSACDCPCGLAVLRRRSQCDFEIEFFEQVLSRSPMFFEAISVLAQRLSEKGRYRRLVALDRRLVTLRPCDPVHRYNLACTLARLGQLRSAIGALEKAVGLGFGDVILLDADADLACLRGHPRFEALRQRLAARS